jgi:hypothetical protein
MNYSVLHAFERMTGLDALGFSGGSHHARWSQESSVLPCPLGGTYLKDCNPDDFMTLGIFGIGYAKGILGGATTTPHPWPTFGTQHLCANPLASHMLRRKTDWFTEKMDGQESQESRASPTKIHQ